MSLPVHTTVDADAQIRVIDEWWRENRRSAPDLFLDELARAFDVIAEAPHVGRVYRLSPIRGTRRVLLDATGYHVYYVIRERDVVVLAVWHGRRGAGPPLRLR